MIAEVVSAEQVGSPKKSEIKTLIKIKKEKYEEILQLQEGYRYIRNTDTNFYSAVKLLTEADVISVFMADVSRGRSKRSSLLAISTLQNIFLFDLEVMGDVCLDKGLRDVLESTDIVKVVYDCRLMSDCLRQKHLTKLLNVRDVEAEDIAVVHQRHGVIRRHTRTLEYLVNRYLGIPIAISLDIEPNMWSERPLSIDLQKTIAVQASFLIPLQKAMEKKYLKRLAIFSDLYNNFLTDADDLTLRNNNSNHTLTSLLTQAVQFLPTQGQCFDK